MFIVTAKINRSKLLAACLFTVALLSGVFVLLFHPAGESDAFHTSLAIDSNEARLEYLAQYGWKLTETPLAEETILVPEDVETSCSAYCALLSEEGFHLAQYAGKEIQRYTYEVLNYPTGETNVQANLLIYEGTVIGGDICTTALDGWMHGLKLPETAPSPSQTAESTTSA